MISSGDRTYLEMAIAQASENIYAGGGPFGAVIVRDGEVLAMAANRVVAEADPTAHAEVLAIRLAARKLSTHDLSGCTLYTSCEPCPMCLGAIYWAGIERVVYAATRHDAAAAGFSDEHIYNEIALEIENRSIEFLNAGEEMGKEIFREWIGFPGKTPY
jgi:guanine deaminase